MAKMREFKCMDCGCEVCVFVDLAANDQDLCLECSWLRGIKNTEEREKLRAWLRRNEQ